MGFGLMCGMSPIFPLVVFSVCMVTRGAVGASVWEVFRNTDVVCLYLVCILWQFSMLHSA